MSMPYIDLCPPEHSLAFHFVIYPIGFIFIFMDPTMGIGTYYFGRYWYSISFD